MRKINLKNLSLKMLLIGSTFFTSPRLKADLWGGDVVVLTQILVQTVQQLIQLKKILSTSQDELNAFRDLHAGINSALENLRVIAPDEFKGIYKELNTVNSVISEIEKSFGKSRHENEFTKLLQRTDHIAAENIFRHNKAFDLSLNLSKSARKIQNHAHNVSPKGAQKLTAQGISLLLEAVTEDLRMNGAQMKLAATEAALKNADYKKSVDTLLTGTQQLSKALKKKNLKFLIPEIK